MPQKTAQDEHLVMLEERKVKALEKIANVLDALTLWFEDIDKTEWSDRLQWYLSEYYEKYGKKKSDKKSPYKKERGGPADSKGGSCSCEE